MRKTPRSIGVLGLLAALVVGASSPAPAMATAGALEPSTLAVRVMSYNVLHAGAATSGKFPRVPSADLDWAVRDDQLVEWIAHEDPDVIGFQENLDEVEVAGRSVLQLHTVAPLLADYEFVRLDNANPIAFRKSRFQLVADGATQIATADGGATLLRDRWLTHATLKDRAGGGQFIVFNTHLSAAAEGPGAATARAAQARRVTTAIRSVSNDLATPLVLTGDLNIKEGSTGTTGAPLAQLAGSGLVNASEWAVVNTTEIPGAVSLQSMT
ncbi:MAG: endonuclease/exonuclease/phosphatase family protein, partial [Propionibacteriaceae bacterium]|nr:endonuclease/exonuclease/phosphatase family protein [Propionibacteriaceae bacterium]